MQIPEGGGVESQERENMGELGLDLSESRAKLGRAREHHEALRARIDQVTQDYRPYTLRWGEVDRVTGVVSLYMKHEALMRHEDLAQYHLGVLLGDVIHNLRSAIDYITAQLALAGGAPIERQQFPIFVDRRAYEKEFGAPGTRNKKATALKGIVHGLELIEGLQPYNREGDPRGDCLWHIHRFSNADKHREIAAEIFRPDKLELSIVHDGGTAVEEGKDLSPAKWRPGVEYEYRRLRFSEPFPTKLRYEADFTVSLLFAVSALKGETHRHAIGPEVVRECCDHVAIIIERFEAL